MTVSQARKAKQFAALHVKGTPVILYKAWDAGSARAIVDAGAEAIATSSWSVASAQGYEDGEDLPLPLAEQIVERIAAAVDVPVTVDFDGDIATMIAGSSRTSPSFSILRQSQSISRPRGQRERALRH